MLLIFLEPPTHFSENNYIYNRIEYQLLKMLHSSQIQELFMIETCLQTDLSDRNMENE